MNKQQQEKWRSQEGVRSIAAGMRNLLRGRNTTDYSGYLSILLYATRSVV